MLNAVSSMFCPWGRGSTKPRQSKPGGGDTAQINTAHKLNTQKPVVATLDIDRTLIPWRTDPDFDRLAYLRYQHTLQDPAFRKRSFVILNTGRGLQGTRELVPIISRFPVDALGLNDGQQLYLRPKDRHGSMHPIEETRQWIMGLKPKHADKDWQKHLNGWSTAAVLREIRQEHLPSLGFEEERDYALQRRLNPKRQFRLFSRQKHPYQPQQGKWVIMMRLDQACFGVTDSNGTASLKDVERFTDLLGLQLKNGLRKNWPAFSYYTVKTPENAYLHFGPKGHSKKTLVNYLLAERIQEKPVALVSAGDGANDVPLLNSHQLAGVPNYPVFVGAQEKALQALAKAPSPNLEQVPWNRLDEGLKRQFAKISVVLPPLSDERPARLDIAV